MSKRIFISYKREDQAIAEQLHQQILDWGHIPWLDKLDIPVGTSWDDAIHIGIKESQIVVGILTPEAVKSKNVLDEWGWALENQRRLILILCRDTLAEDIPPRYIRSQRIDLRENDPAELIKLQKALSSSTAIIPENDDGLKASRSPIDTSKKPNIDAYRESILKRVEDNWIHSVLDRALEAGQFELDMEFASPHMLLQHIDYGDYQLPDTSNILDVFQDMNSELLILGDPGAGKTVLLIQLAKKLIIDARDKLNKPIPVIFNLSSWAEKRKPLDEWLEDEFQSRYRIQRATSNNWISREKLILLLDGLDEVAPSYQGACVNAINDFHKHYLATGLVICSRVGDYGRLSSKLNMRGAITIQPLSKEQIERYLNRPEFAAIWQAVREDEVLQTLAETPFLLNTIAYAYKDMSATSLQLPISENTAKARQKHLFDALLKKRFAVSLSNNYIATQSRHYLAWLANKMNEFKQTIFYIEGLQPQWTEGVNHRIYILLSSITGGLLSAFIILPLMTISVSSLMTILNTVASILCILFGGFITARSSITPVETLNLSWSKLSLELKNYYYQVPFVRKLWNRRWIRLLIGIYLAIQIIPTWALGNTVTAITLTFLYAFVLFVAIIGFPSLLLIATGDALAKKQAEIKLQPNQGIKLSTYNGLKVMIIVGLISYVVLLPVISYAQKNLNISVSPLIGVSLGVFSGLSNGLFAPLKHFILRITLWYSKYSPWNYAQFLNYCVEIGLLRKVGGGYIFAHRYLLDYFAESDF